MATHLAAAARGRRSTACLLGLGFTTFVLTFAVWAVAALAFAIGDPGVGVAAGIAFGVGRALPVVVVAPLLDGPSDHSHCERCRSGPPCSAARVARTRSPSRSS